VFSEAELAECLTAMDTYCPESAGDAQLEGFVNVLPK
jgi:hypothetical protein